MWHGDFYPFGREPLSNGSDPSHYKFTGMERDSESGGFDHATFRQYSSTQGRWMSPDPYLGSMDITNPQSLNRYAYVSNQPTMYIDPLGLNQIACYSITTFDGSDDTGVTELFCFGGGGGGGSGAGGGGGGVSAPNNPPQTPKQKCINKFLANNYGNFLAQKVVPDFSLVSIATKLSGYVKSSVLTLGIKGSLVAAPKLLGIIASKTATNLSAYPGMAIASADAAETGLFWATTATTAEWLVVPIATAATVFSTTADLDARFTCRNVP
jgi:RHS repeat-associated protein